MQGEHRLGRRLPVRLDDPEQMRQAVEWLLGQDFDCRMIEKTLVRMMPVDLDLLQECLASYRPSAATPEQRAA